jgi:hypothetical protein
VRRAVDGLTSLEGPMPPAPGAASLFHH